MTPYFILYWVLNSIIFYIKLLEANHLSNHYIHLMPLTDWSNSLRMLTIQVPNCCYFKAFKNCLYQLFLYTDSINIQYFHLKVLALI